MQELKDILAAGHAAGGRGMLSDVPHASLTSQESDLALPVAYVYSLTSAALPPGQMLAPDTCSYRGGHSARCQAAAGQAPRAAG